MKQALRVPSRLPQALFPGRSALTSIVIGVAASGSAAAHVAAATVGTPGIMAWLMAAMGMACLACLLPLMRGRSCATRTPGGGAPQAARHLLVMSAAMVLFHTALLGYPGHAGHHGRAATGSPAAHGEGMLTLIAVELACLAAASVMLRIGRPGPKTPRPVEEAGTPVPAAVEP
ncbi:hypothetical protein ACIPY2_10380 [Paenarthrobacter sp. NPDC089675]|uniref:hypothetical protein n=1 Tax=Paenarthrobacter sp. NPDC089675 TaxID=3364376 RepID=UPI0037F7A2A0